MRSWYELMDLRDKHNAGITYIDDHDGGLGCQFYVGACSCGWTGEQHTIEKLAFNEVSQHLHESLDQRNDQCPGFQRIEVAKGKFAQRNPPQSGSLKGKCTCSIGLLPCQLHGWEVSE